MAASDSQKQTVEGAKKRSLGHTSAAEHFKTNISKRQHRNTWDSKETRWLYKQWLAKIFAPLGFVLLQPQPLKYLIGILCGIFLSYLSELSTASHLNPHRLLFRLDQDHL